jgi:uncharacterized membrane protein
VAFIDVSRLPLVRPVDRPRDQVATPDKEHTRAGVALAVAWGALAVVFGVYAIAEQSVGAVVLMLAVIAILRAAWTGAWRDEEPSSAAVKREISLLP